MDARWLGLSRNQERALAGAIVVVLLGALAVGGLAHSVRAHDGLAARDAANLHFFIVHRSPTWIRLARWATWAGDITVLAPVAVAATVALWRAGVRLALAAAPALALALAGAVTAVAKQVVGRPRPPLGLRLARESAPSFPSGHATDSSALYLGLALVVAIVVLRRPLARVAAVAAAVLLQLAVGLTRLELGVHYPTDVLAGWALGSGTAVAVVVVALLVARIGPPASAASGPTSGR